MSRHSVELRQRTAGELLQLLQETQQELMTLRFQLANRQATNQARVGILRKEVARIKTLLREDQLRRTS